MTFHFADSTLTISDSEIGPILLTWILTSIFTGDPN